MEIQLLSCDVINQISAGEVIERPANLVKELVENSLDAGATEIQVDYDQGGRFLKVQDNGWGISQHEIPLALARHATSKIRKTADLWQLQSFGFRGEALASASAVSRLTITSRTPQSASGYRLNCQFGTPGPLTDCSAPQGTAIQIDDLFENVPARLKFLKSEAAEGTQIRRVLKALALAHPQVTFQIRCGGKLLTHYRATTSPLTRAQEVLDVDPLYESHSERSGLSCTVYFASPQHTQRTSQNLWFFAQNRWIQDRTIQASVIEAYRTLLMHGEFPQAAVFLTCDPSRVDVNVHPTKSLVKFEDAAHLYQVVQAAVRSGLEQAPWNPKVPTPTLSLEEVRNRVETYSAGFTETKTPPLFRSHNVGYQFQDRAHDAPVVTAPVQMPLAPATQAPQTTNEKGFWGSLEILGQANLTYVIAQSRKSLFLIDQHAAHERVAFERLHHSWKSGKFETQNYLIPLTIDMEPHLLEGLLVHSQSLERMGLTVEQMGPALLAVQSAPSILKESAIQQALLNMAVEIHETGGSYSIENKINGVLATMACHSVVRAGQTLSHDEMQSLLAQMDEFSLSTFCPHGRPVYSERTFMELDREFGRIV